MTSHRGLPLGLPRGGAADQLQYGQSFRDADQDSGSKRSSTALTQMGSTLPTRGRACLRSKRLEHLNTAIPACTKPEACLRPIVTRDHFCAQARCQPWPRPYTHHHRPLSEPRQSVRQDQSYFVYNLALVILKQIPGFVLNTINTQVCVSREWSLFCFNWDPAGICMPGLKAACLSLGPSSSSVQISWLQVSEPHHGLQWHYGHWRADPQGKSGPEKESATLPTHLRQCLRGPGGCVLLSCGRESAGGALGGRCWGEMWAQG